MKMIMAVVQDQDAQELLEKLLSAGHRATRLSTTGGFLRQGNSTFMIGIENDSLDDVMRIIEETCRSRQQVVTPWVPMGSGGDAFVPEPIEVTVGGATVFVLPLEELRKI